MTKSKSARPAFSLRVQPYDVSLLAEVVHYLNSLDRAEATRRIESVLVMALLTQARLYDPTCSPEERRRCCIGACDALEKHASMLRQLVGVEAKPVMEPRGPSFAEPTTENRVPVAEQAALVYLDEAEGDEADYIDQPPPKSRLKAKVAPGDVDALFGG